MIEKIEKNKVMKHLEPSEININNEHRLVEGNHRMQAVQAIGIGSKHPKRGRGRPEKVSKQMFMEAWNKCNSLKEVAEVLGIPTTSASVKASNMRKSGCNLKLYKRGAKRKLACK